MRPAASRAGRKYGKIVLEHEDGELCSRKTIPEGYYYWRCFDYSVRGVTLDQSDVDLGKEHIRIDAAQSSPRHDLRKQSLHMQQGNRISYSCSHAPSEET